MANQNKNAVVGVVLDTTGKKGPEMRASVQNNGQGCQQIQIIGKSPIRRPAAPEGAQEKVRPTIA